MCEICRKYLCPAGCPSYSGDSAELGRRLYACSECGKPIYKIDNFGTQYGKPYCAACYRRIKHGKRILCRDGK